MKADPAVPKCVSIVRPVWPVLERLGEALASRGETVEFLSSWESLLEEPAEEREVTAVFLGEYGDVAGEEEILRKFRTADGSAGVPVFLVGGRIAQRMAPRFRAAGADQVLAADLTAAEILDRAAPLLAYADRYRNALTANRDLKRSGMVDDLTGLPNRRQFSRELDRCVELSRRIGRPISCIVSDIDDFRRVNEEHGLRVGDSVIRQFAGVLNAAKRKYDNVARLGGDEFVWLLLDADAERAAKAAHRAHRTVSGSMFNGEHEPVRVTATWGVATLSPGGDWTGKSLMENADRALYWGKESGKNRVRCYPPGKAEDD